MRMDASTLKFDPQVMALAMPSESGFGKAADGVSNLGKVFQAQQDRESAQALNALKMEEANQSILAKKNENSVFGEKRQEEKDLHTANLGFKKSEKILKDIESNQKQFTYDKEVKELEESGVLKQLRGMLPKEAYMNADGTPDRTVIANSRAAFISTPEWKDRAHIINAAFDGIEADLFKGAKDKLEVDDKSSIIAKRNLEALTVIPESNAKVASWLASEKSANSTAAYNNIKTKQAPQELINETEKVGVSKDNSKLDKVKENRQAIKDRFDEIKDPNFGKDIEGHSNLSPDDQAKYNIRYAKGNPTYITKKIEPHFYGDTVTYSLSDTPPKTPAPASPDKGIAIGTVKTNASTHQKAQWDGKGWVLMK